MSRLLTIVAIATVCALAAGASRANLEPEALAVGQVRDPTWLPDGQALRVASMGQRQLLASAYWLKTVQYMGDVGLGGGDWRALYPLADITTDLDPRFGYVYQVAGSNLAGLAHRYDEADRILLKGMQNVPDRWSLPWTHAVNKFLYQRDFATAAEYARRAAEIGKRPHLALLAANLSLVADDDSEYAAAEAVLDVAIAQAAVPELRAELEQRRVKVRTFQALSRVERALAELQRRTGRRPMLLLDLLAAGVLPEIPLDPSGGTLAYDPLTGKVRSTVLGERAPLQVTHE
jgi:tetratricopeptide (TPR) repeat protein